ncbi:HNH endonuclease [Archangium sp.]|uniref:HNH endonuclease n=1 Tax=Archangium sp. TaxID=1872627 RepID=UPI002D4ECAD4|nr:HNH endonuclease [Archangium sp.]HYO51940.1 HNH endonuclease [Archangium sp.]
MRSPVRPKPMEVSQAEYNAAMVRFARELRDKLPPRPEKQLEVISWGSPEQRDERAQLVVDYYQWCDARGTPGDCFGLLNGLPYLTEEAKRALAFALANPGVWDGTAAVIDEVLDPVQIQIALVSTITLTFALLAIPEPISKVIVIVVTASLVGYVGWDTLVGLIEGWRQLEEECKRARTFSELRQAGERYGRLMGEKVTRLLILAATAALTSGGGRFINGGLPGLPQASRFATSEGFAFQVLGQTRSIQVVGRSLTVTMEGHALFMANQGMSNGGGGSSRPSPPAPAASFSKYRLRSLESWRKPRLTKDGQILPFKKTREPARPIPNLGSDRAGQTVTDGKTTVRFDKNGFPELETKFEIILEDVHIGSGRPELHIRAANQKLFDAIKADPDLAKVLKLSQEQINRLLSFNRAPGGYTWHHHQDVGRMQLVEQGPHLLSRPHTGGMAIWGGGY